MAYRLLVSFAVALLCAGCAGTGPTVEAPAVRLNSVEVTSLSLSSQHVVLSFDVGNPNPFPLPVRAIRYQVLLENQRFAGGETTEHFTIPAGGDGAFSIDVQLDLMRSASSLLSIIGGGVERPLRYRLQGSLHVALPFAPPLDFASDGTIKVHGDRR